MLRHATLVTLILVALSPLAAAVPIGASGQCYNEDATAGGEDKVEIDTDDPTAATLPSGTGAANAVVLYATGHDAPESLDGCRRIDCGTMGAPACPPGEDARVDYVEVHVGSTQVCYARGFVWTNGLCPTTPTGP